MFCNHHVCKARVQIKIVVVVVVVDDGHAACPAHYPGQLEFENVSFYVKEKGKPENMRNTFQRKDTNQEQTQPAQMYEAKSRKRTWATMVGGKCSDTTTTSLLPLIIQSIKQVLYIFFIHMKTDQKLMKYFTGRPVKLTGGMCLPPNS